MNAQGDSSTTEPESGLTVDEQWNGQVAVISATGAIDMLTAPQLADGIRAAEGKSPKAVIVNLTDVDFLASAGMQVLVAAKEQLGGTRLVVVADGPATSRPLTITGITDLIDLYASLDEALENLTV